MKTKLSFFQILRLKNRIFIPTGFYAKLISSYLFYHFIAQFLLNHWRINFFVNDISLTNLSDFYATHISLTFQCVLNDRKSIGALNKVVLRFCDL